LTLKKKHEILKIGGGALPLARAEIHHASMPRGYRDKAISGGASGRQEIWESPGSLSRA
jgi:hypothetical protein